MQLTAYATDHCFGVTKSGTPTHVTVHCSSTAVSKLWHMLGLTFTLLGEQPETELYKTPRLLVSTHIHAMIVHYSPRH